MSHLVVQVQTVSLFEAIATATTVGESRSALDLAVLALDHENTSIHDATCMGITLLTRCLQRDVKSADHELNTLYLRAICMLLRCSDENAIAAVHQIGADLVSLVLTLVDDGEMDSASKGAVGELFDRLAELYVSWPDIGKNEFLIRLMQRITRRGECCFLASVTVLLLGGWSQQPTSKRYLFNQPGLVDDILASTRYIIRLPQICSTVYESNYFLLHIANLLRSLAWNANSKSELVSKPGFLDVLVLLLSFNKNEGENATVRAIAHDMLRQLCTEGTCRRAVCKHDKGSIVRALLARDDPILNQTVLHTILRLIGHDTAHFLFKKETHLVERLEQAAKMDMDNPNVVSDASSILAAHALKRVATYVSVRSCSHPALLEALIVLATAKNLRIRLWAVQGLQEQSKTSSGRFYMTRTSTALTTLIRIAKVDPCNSVKGVAIESLLAIALDTANAKRLANNSDLLETFAETASQKLQETLEFQPSARCAIQAILSLACHKTTNKHRVAKTIGLVESLSRFGVSQDTDTELKHAALHCVIVLAPLM